MDASFVIPCYRSPASLRNLVSDLVEHATAAGHEFEIVLVQDSPDPETSLVLETLSEQFETVRVVRLSRNFGQQAATVAGIVESFGDIIVTMNDDYQHKPIDAIGMIKLLLDNPDFQLVYARPLAPSDSTYRVRNGKLFREVLRFAGLKFAESLSPFRAFRGYLRDPFQTVSGPTVSVDVILSWVVDRVETVECEFKFRENGVSGYTKKTLVKLALKILFTYTTRPLRAGIYLGFAGVTASLIFASVILGRYVVGGIAVAGFTTTTLLVLFIGSVQLLILGVLGVYLGEQHQRGMRRPAFLLRED